jgi:hypothetical protein
MSIQEALRSALGGDPTLTGLVSDRIYPGQIPPDDAPAPWLYYAVTESVPLDQLDATNTPVRSEVEFHSLGDHYADAKAVIDAVLAVLATYVGGVITRSLWAGTSEDVTEEGYHHAVRFTVWWTMA